MSESSLDCASAIGELKKKNTEERTLELEFENEYRIFFLFLCEHRIKGKIGNRKIFANNKPMYL